jgi:hypothetical protein
MKIKSNAKWKGLLRVRDDQITFEVLEAKEVEHLKDKELQIETSYRGREQEGLQSAGKWRVLCRRALF